MAAKKKATKKKAAKKKASAKKAAPKKVAKKKAAKKAPAKKAAAKKKAAPAKKAAAKKAAAKKAPAKKAAATKSAGSAKAAAKPTPARRKKAVKRRARSTRRDDDDDGAEGYVPTTEAAADAPPPPLPPEAEEEAPPPPRRRGRPIPALPDDEPFEAFDDDAGSTSRELPADASPAEVLDQVRAGTLHVSVLEQLPSRALGALAREYGVRRRRGERTSALIYRLVDAKRPSEDDTREAPRRGRQPRKPLPPQEPVAAEGLLEIHPDGYGFLRTPRRDYSQHPTDVYVSAGLIRGLGLQQGHWLTGTAERPNPNQPQLAMKTIEEVNHDDPARIADVVPFEKLTVVYPDQRLMLETERDDIETRVIDLFCPLGMGQRGLIVAPPRSGKTVLLTKVADAIAMNHPEVDIVVLLVDERPEEVTNMRRSVRGEVIASTFDRPASNHVRVAELVVDKVKRMVELGRDVVLLLDSITRMGRAYNNQAGGSGRIMSGGLDANALSKPKRFFGSARNVEDGGSLTIVASALIDTGSKMDEVIFEEFKGTGNMEIVLNRDMSNNRVWPAIDLPASGTRNEDLLLHPDELKCITLLRRSITGQDPTTVMTSLRKKLLEFSSNAQFLMAIRGTPPAGTPE